MSDEMNPALVALYDAVNEPTMMFGDPEPMEVRDYRHRIYPMVEAVAAEAIAAGNRRPSEQQPAEPRYREVRDAQGRLLRFIGHDDEGEVWEIVAEPRVEEAAALVREFIGDLTDIKPLGVEKLARRILALAALPATSGGEEDLASRELSPTAIGALDWHAPMEKPARGRKIVAVYDDGSGAQLAFVTDEGFIDADGDDRDEDWLIDHMSGWAYLPPRVKLWCEIRGGDDQFTFPDEPPGAPADA